MSRPYLSIVAPVYNEQECLGEFYGRIKKMLKEIACSYEIIFVDDGSADASPRMLDELSQKDPHIRVLHFSRNFGHQIAIKAGIDHARGEAVVLIDTDLQDPPELIPRFVEKWKEGYDVVYAVRAKRAGESVFKRATAFLFYRGLRAISRLDIPLDTGDFRLISGRVAQVLSGMKERKPYIRGLVSWMGFKQTGITIERQGRFAGKTKYSLRKMLGLAFSGILHFSFVPLHIPHVLGGLCFVFALAGYAGGNADPWANLALFLASLQFIVLGFIANYLAHNFDESRQRPLYVLRDDAESFR